MEKIFRDFVKMDLDSLRKEKRKCSYISGNLGEWRNFNVMVWHDMVQWFALENQQSLFYVVNEVTLTGQNPSLKCCQPLEILRHFITGLDLSMIEIWCL